MSVLFSLVFLASVPALLIGLINPRWVMPKNAQNPTRRLTTGIYGSIAIASLLCIGVTNSPDTPPTSSTSSPVASPLPDASPVAIAPSAASPSPSTPKPSPVASVVSSPVAPSLEISRSAIQSVFSKPEIGFFFEPSSDVQGEPRVTGKSPNGLASIELIGQPEDLSEIGMMLGIVNDNQQATMLNALYALGLMKLIAPEWDGAGEWLNQGLQKIAAGQEEVSITQNDKRIKLSFVKGFGLMFISIKPAR